MNFNQDKIKLKYILGMHKDMPGYPTGEDILYYVIKRHHEKGKEGSVTFTDNLLFKKLGAEYSDIITESLNKLVHDDYVSIQRETNESITYKVLKNDYINAI
jgi:hypothetical protein